MSDDDEEVESQESEDKATPIKWSWTNFFSLMVGAVGQWFHLCGIVMEQISGQMDCHVTWVTDREKFAERAALEIEALVAAPKPKARPKSRR